MKKVLMKILDAILFPFLCIAVLIDESKSINEDGSWSEYQEKRR